MNFWMIFLCLLIGCVIGYEFGRYTVSKKIHGILSGVADELKETAEKMKKREPVQTKISPLVALGVIGFDTRQYKTSDEIDILEGFDQKKEIDLVSALISNMVIKGATDAETGRAIRYSMVVVDTKKQHLDWRQSRKDEGIDILCEKYMNKELVNHEEN